MACMSHDCGTCGHAWADNQPRPACPKCGSTDVSHDFDEDPADHDYDREDERDEDREEE